MRPHLSLATGLTNKAGSLRPAGEYNTFHALREAEVGNSARARRAARHFDLRRHTISPDSRFGRNPDGHRVNQYWKVGGGDLFRRKN